MYNDCDMYRIKHVIHRTGIFYHEMIRLTTFVGMEINERKKNHAQKNTSFYHSRGIDRIFGRLRKKQGTCHKNRLLFRYRHSGNDL